MTRAELARRELEIARAYRETLTAESALTEAARIVLGDISEFCRIRDAKPIKGDGGTIDPVAHVYRDGMRAVWEHINKRLAADIQTLQSEATRDEQ